MSPGGKEAFNEYNMSGRRYGAGIIRDARMVCRINFGFVHRVLIEDSQNGSVVRGVVKLDTPLNVNAERRYARDQQLWTGVFTKLR